MNCFVVILKNSTETLVLEVYDTKEKALKYIEDKAFKLSKEIQEEFEEIISSNSIEFKLPLTTIKLYYVEKTIL